TLAGTCYNDVVTAHIHRVRHGEDLFRFVQVALGQLMSFDYHSCDETGAGQDAFTVIRTVLRRT
ncbi:MAG: hypothetical protein ACI89J_001006, partial [Hyphomicrobiaceae bacterium]